MVNPHFEGRYWISSSLPRGQQTSARPPVLAFTPSTSAIPVLEPGVAR